ncbi:MAG: hypothetical protein M0Z46_03305 [Actinomycetota bacterium]|nr:hypothetical protein [Actinomycetota bacterium]
MGKSRFSISDLAPSAPLTEAATVRLLESCWDRDKKGDDYKDVDWRKEWQNLQALGSRFLAAADGPDDGGVEWHHLLVGVGNFKRQSPIGVGVTIPSAAPPSRDSFTIPTRGQTVAMTSKVDPGNRQEPEMWRALTSIPGVGVPTATAILAALWRGEHFIFDRRVRFAVIGLVCGPKWASDPTLDGKSLPLNQDWELYAWARKCLRKSASSKDKLLALERGLYVLDLWTMKSIADSKEPNGWTWREYADRAREILSKRAKSPGETTP